jgi:hypothetical protein
VELLQVELLQVELLQVELLQVELLQVELLQVEVQLKGIVPLLHLATSMGHCQHFPFEFFNARRINIA